MIFGNIKNRLKSDPKKLVAVGSLCLVIGLMLPYLFHPSTQLSRNLMEGFRGMFLGFSICINFWAVMRKKKNKEMSGCDGVTLRS